MIEPQSEVRLLSVPFEADQHDTILFKTRNRQTEWMIDQTKWALSKFTYLRKENAIRVDIPVDELYNVNYVMYRNDGFTDKWFYAFIIATEFVNQNVTRIYIAEDSFQTWFYDVTFFDSFVVRAHTSNDTVGNNIVAEPVVAPISYINSVNEQKITVTGTNIMVSSEPTNDDPDPETGLIPFEASTSTDPYSGIVCPYRVFTGTMTAPSLKTALDSYLKNGQMEGVMGTYPVFSDVTISLSRPSSLNGYTPRNNKLLTGQYVNYTFELAGQSLSVSPDLVANPTMTSKPNAIYLFNSPLACGAYDVYLTNFGAAANPTSMRLEISVPVIPWAYNSYSNTTALQANATAMMIRRNEATRWEKGITGALDVGGGVSTMANEATKAAATAGLSVALTNTEHDFLMGTKQAVGGGFDVAEAIGGYGAESEAIARHNANLLAPATGATAVTNNLIAKDQLYLSGYVWTILKDDAQRIDKFFDMYGYAWNEVMNIKPYLDNRENWNYIKTSHLMCTADIPFTSLRNIKALFNKGITFWHNPSTYGDYSNPNNIV